MTKTEMEQILSEMAAELANLRIDYEKFKQDVRLALLTLNKRSQIPESLLRRLMTRKLS